MGLPIKNILLQYSILEQNILFYRIFYSIISIIFYSITITPPCHTIRVVLTLVVPLILNKRHKHSLSINYTNFKKVLGLGLGLVLVNKDSRVHNLNLTVRSVCILVLCLLFLFLFLFSYSCSPLLNWYPHFLHPLFRLMSTVPTLFRTQVKNMLLSEAICRD